ncbi:hypothetical protein [Ancylobacter amanitiformis]|uniref:Uncharacterized protein n=1 Tax=Ancylobacter amanitiformis TaxID=217069 RepID=A0ABU0LVE6_9HYPH|nr:hypothetical protein [Ancylobacter amanitiformis]MDQ0512707.1 hypothetical protein [Ancylobacter amanitiformis]
MGNVVNLIPAPTLACSRKREEALGVIIPRLKRLRSTAGAYGIAGRVTFDIATVNDLTCHFHETAEGIYFRVDADGDRRPLMTGYYDNRGRTAQTHGPVHVMSWRRGWEDRLF